VTERGSGGGDAVVVGGNRLRAVGVVSALERRLRCAAVTANQALLWATPRAAGADTSRVASTAASSLTSGECNRNAPSLSRASAVRAR
jgi:maleate isomerase